MAEIERQTSAPSFSESIRADVAAQTWPTLAAALDEIGIPAASNLRIVCRDHTNYSGRYLDAIRSGHTEVPSARALLTEINSNRDAHINDPTTHKGTFNARGWAHIWNAWRHIAGGLDGKLYPDASTFAKALADWTHAILALYAADGAAQRARREGAEAEVERVLNEMAPVLERLEPLLEMLADALSAAGKKPEASEVRRHFIGAVHNLIAQRYHLPRD